MKEYNIQQIISLYQEGYSSEQIAAKIGLSSSGVRKILIRNNVKLRNSSQCHRKYKINENLLDKIDTQEKAYFLGFFYADGCNLNNTSCISLASQDIDILYRFSEMFFKENSKERILSYIRKRQNKTELVSKLSFNSKYLCSQLTILGAPRAKTFKIKYPDWLDENLHNHFIRGYFDGDGSIYQSNNKFGWKIASTESMCKGINAQLIKNLGIDISVKPQGNIFNICCSGNKQIHKIMTWLYKDATIFLQRKYLKFQSLIQLYETVGK